MDVIMQPAEKINIGIEDKFYYEIMRARQLPCQDVVVYCIGCVRAMEYAGKETHYLPDLLLNRPTEPMADTLDEYHDKLLNYIGEH